MKKKISGILLIFLFILAGCAKLNQITDTITNPSARSTYKRDFGNDGRYPSWESAFKLAVSDHIEISLPYAEKGKFDPLFQNAYSYTLALKEGEVLSAQVRIDSLQKQIFYDLFEVNTGGIHLVESSKKDQHHIEFSINRTGTYRLVIQPEIDANSAFTLLINKKPQYGFPVAGKGNSAIQSFMGMPRDNGQRSHEGIDIFAKRGTPVVAATDGIITGTGDHGLGGKQVWQRAGVFGNSLYYAHLDEIKVTAGSRVQAGDALGFVGNTGNAKGGPPHLHFGIYRSNGAVDPLPFVYQTSEVNSASFKKSFKKQMLKISTAKAAIRQSPDSKSTKFGELKKSDTVVLLGQHKEWLHIKTLNGRAAFLHKDLVKEL